MTAEKDVTKGKRIYFLRQSKNIDDFLSGLWYMPDLFMKRVFFQLLWWIVYDPSTNDLPGLLYFKNNNGYFYYVNHIFYFRVSYAVVC